MEEKKVKIEVSRLAFVFIILFGLSLLVWSFVIGVWVGTKIGGESKKEEIAMESPTTSHEQETVTPPPLISNETAPPAVKITPPVATKKPGVKETSKEEKKTTEYQKKEVSKIASQIKKITTPYYSIQIGAFSKKEMAEAFKNKAKVKGFGAFIKESKENGRVLYKVYVGKYSTREEAKKHIAQVAKVLNIKKPFIVEIK
ncbi:MAG: SPOR domain-containing protein [Thermodesulfobacterium sp.]|nr:SPOR domain-containing protein [Thermodesulfobacterium sp.]